MKALKILNELSFTISKYTSNEDIIEAIKELETLQENKTCDGCKHYVAINKSDTMVCALNMDCIRRYKLRDRWESKQC